MAKKKTKKSKDLVSDALALGFGLMDITKERLGECLEEFRGDRKISKKDSEKAVKNLKKRLGVEKNKKELEKIIQKSVKKIVSELGLATKEDLKKLEKKVKK